MRSYLFGAACSVALAGLLVAADVEARAEKASRYSKTQTYNGALRYVRVDLGYEITEKDSDAAYLLFRYQPPGRKDTTHGSIEVIENGDDVKIFVQLPKMPSYHERVLIDGLMRKLRTEYGKPPDKAPPEPPAGDAGADDEN